MKKKLIRSKQSEVGICIPTYNSEKYILTTVNSILNQSYKNFSLHIIDDNSIDETLKILKKIKDKRIKIYRQRQNKGIFQNLNECLKRAKSKYVKIVCADDILEPDSITKQVNILKRYPEVVLVYNASKIINKNDRVIAKRNCFDRNRLVNGGVLINKILKTGRNPLGEPASIMMRLDILKKNNLMFSRSFQYIGDLDLWINILKFGKGYYINKYLNYFRLHNGSSTIRLFRRAMKEHLKLVYKYKDEFDLTFFDLLMIKFRLLFYFVIKIFFILLINLS